MEIKIFDIRWVTTETFFHQSKKETNNWGNAVKVILQAVIDNAGLLNQLPNFLMKIAKKVNSVKVSYWGLFGPKTLTSLRLSFQTKNTLSGINYGACALTINHNPIYIKFKHMNSVKKFIRFEEYSLINMRQLQIKPKLDIGLFVDFCVFTCFCQFLHDMIIKLFCFDLQNNIMITSSKNW